MAALGPMSSVFICFLISLSFGHGYFYNEDAIGNAAGKFCFSMFVIIIIIISFFRVHKTFIPTSIIYII